MVMDLKSVRIVYVASQLSKIMGTTQKNNVQFQGIHMHNIALISGLIPCYNYHVCMYMHHGCSSTISNFSVAVDCVYQQLVTLIENFTLCSYMIYQSPYEKLPGSIVLCTPSKCSYVRCIIIYVSYMHTYVCTQVYGCLL